MAQCVFWEGSEATWECVHNTVTASVRSLTTQPPISLPPSSCPLLQLSYRFPSLPSSFLQFPYHFHMTPSEARLPRATVATIKHFGWQRVAMITENKQVFTAGTLHTKSVCVSHTVYRTSSVLPENYFIYYYLSVDIICFAHKLWCSA